MSKGRTMASAGRLNVIVKKPGTATRTLLTRINKDLEEHGLCIDSLRWTSKGYEYLWPCDQFDELSKEEMATIRHMVEKHCGKKFVRH